MSILYMMPSGPVQIPSGPGGGKSGTLKQDFRNRADGRRHPKNTVRP